MKTTEELVSIKARCAERLQTEDIGKYRLSSVDKRLDDYIGGCISDIGGHNLYELLAVERFLRFMQGYEMRAKEAQAFISFYEALKFTGIHGMTRYRLTPIQVFQFASIMGFYHAGTGKRLTREALLFVPRKFSKTTGVASFAIWDLLFGDSNAQAYVAANSYNQAKICFDEIRNILRTLDKRLSRFKINREAIFNLDRTRSSFIRCLASRANRLDGLNASTVILDEYAQADSPDTKNVLTSSMGARLNPLTLIITTASDKQDSPFTEMLDIDKSILLEEIENDSIFAHIFQPDVSDDELSPATWRKVQPHMGVTVREDFYFEAARKAAVSSQEMKEFRNKLLNLFTSGTADTWIKRSRIEQLSVSLRPSTLEKATCVCSVDLSVKDDFSCVTYLFVLPKRYHDGNLCQLHSISEYYFPAGQLKSHVNGDMYEAWAKKGYLHLCEGEVIDYAEIVENICKKPWVIRALGYDKYKSGEFIQRIIALQGDGPLMAVPQTYGAFNSPTESMELAVSRGAITFDPNPITSFCFGNAVIDSDKLGNRKPIRKALKFKVDGAITNIMCLWLLNNVQI